VTNSSIEALESSIQKWEKIQSLVEEGKFNSAREVLQSPCPLCSELWEDSCRSCALRQLTGEVNCYATPFYAIRQLLTGIPWSCLLKEVIYEPGQNTLPELISEMIGMLENCRNIIHYGVPTEEYRD